MPYTIIDRTLNGKRTSGSRQRFVRRVKKQIRDQINKHITKGNVDDLVNNKKRKINVPKKDLTQPTFQHGKGGRRFKVLPGNKEFVPGDRINRPQGGGGGSGGSKGSKDGEGEDDFIFTLTHEEFLDIFFEDCELPNLHETVIAKTDAFETKRAGFAKEGSAAQLNVERTMRQSKGRRIGLMRNQKRKKLRELEAEEARLVIEIAEAEAEGKDTFKLEVELEEIRRLIKVQEKKLRAIPFVDDTDLRYNKWDRVPVPTYQAVMGCLMDVSASMGEREKELAKRFFMMEYLFLKRNHERVDVVWIRHHTSAKEVDEEEFFKSRETGGTQISTALTLFHEIIKERYPVDAWNIYGSQVSDGDNWSNDSPVALDVLENSLLPIVRYYAYIEIVSNRDMSSRPVSDIWPHYQGLATKYPNFQMKQVATASDIYPVFKELFKKRRSAKYATQT